MFYNGIRVDAIVSSKCPYCLEDVEYKDLYEGNVFDAAERVENVNILCPHCGCALTLYASSYLSLALNVFPRIKEDE